MRVNFNLPLRPAWNNYARKHCSSYFFHTTNENGARKRRKSLILLVGGAGLEPATPAV